MSGISGQSVPELFDTVLADQQLDWLAAAAEKGRFLSIQSAGQKRSIRHRVAAAFAAFAPHGARPHVVLVVLSLGRLVGPRRSELPTSAVVQPIGPVAPELYATRPLAIRA
jgi:hypothetical protein